MNNKLLKRAIIDTVGTALYVFLVSQLLRHGNQILGSVENNFLAPMLFLLLFVFSALVTGYLILGKPIMMYIDGMKKDAVKLLFYTGASLFVLILIGLILIIAIK